jgi:hypothetical protein
MPLLKSTKFDPCKHSAKFLNFINMFIQKREFNPAFNLSCSRLARKQSNHKLATRLLTSHLTHLAFNSNNSSSSSNSPVKDLYEATKSLTAVLAEANYALETRVKVCDIEREAAKLLNVTDVTLGRTKSIELLASSVATHMDTLAFNANNALLSNSKSHATEETLNEKQARSILTLTKWLAASQSDLKRIVKTLNEPDAYMNNSANNVSQIELLCFSLHNLLNAKRAGFDENKLSLSKRGMYVSNQNRYITSETLIGDLIDLSTVLSPKLAKSWHSLGDWCYKLAKKSVEKLIIDDSSAHAHQAMLLNDEELVIIGNLLPTSASEVERAFIKRLFTRGLSPFSSINEQQASTTTSSTDKDLQIDALFRNASNLNSELGRELFFTEARKLLAEHCASLTTDHISSILDVYRNLISRVYYYYKISCNSYFTYLQHSAKVFFFLLPQVLAQFTMVN